MSAPSPFRVWKCRPTPLGLRRLRKKDQTPPYFFIFHALSVGSCPGFHTGFSIWDHALRLLPQSTHIASASPSLSFFYIQDLGAHVGGGVHMLQHACGHQSTAFMEDSLLLSLHRFQGSNPGQQAWISTSFLQTQLAALNSKLLIKYLRCPIVQFSGIYNIGQHSYFVHES